MADASSLTAFEDVPLEEARCVGRGLRVASYLYQELRTRLQSVSDHAVQMTLPNGTSPTP
jgi:hypothetical protein